MTYRNGYLPDSALASIPGGRLAIEAAAAWNAMLEAAGRRGLAIPMPDGPDSSYRDYARQVYWKQYWCAQGHCENAATPGTSRHGMGIAVDCDDQQHRATIAAIGEAFGWSQKWSDAPWEPWHHTYKTGLWKPPPPVLRFGDTGWKVIGLTANLATCGYLPHFKWSFDWHVHGAVVAFKGKHHIVMPSLASRQDRGVVDELTNTAIAQAADLCNKRHRKEYP